MRRRRGALPAGWRNLHQGGAKRRSLEDQLRILRRHSPAAFHQEAEDGPAPGTATRFERLVSPNIVFPADSEYALLDYDVCYDLEDDPNFNIQAFDAWCAFLRRHAGPLPRAFHDGSWAQCAGRGLETEFTTGSFKNYRSTFRGAAHRVLPGHERMVGRLQGRPPRAPTAAGHAGQHLPASLRVQQDRRDVRDLRSGHVCGASVDNIVLRSVKSVAPAR